MSGQESSTILSPTTSASGGSGRAPCPLDDFELPQRFGAEVVSLPSSLDLPMAEQHSIREELIRLGASDEERIEYLQARLSMLRDWIKSAFGVDDPHVELPVQSPKVYSGSPQEPTDSTAGTVGGGDSASNVGTSTVAAMSAPPVLRIKLVDEKSGQKPSATGVSRATGTGSKNLSRMMSRPPTEGASAEAKAKLASQTPINVFWNYIEPFFKPIDENDLRSLEDGSRFIDPLPFTISPLGRHYEERWREQYGYVSSRPASGATRRTTTSSSLGADQQAQMPSHPPLRVSSIRERLLAMMIEENLTVPETEGSSSSSSGSSSAHASASDLTSAALDDCVDSTGGKQGAGGGSSTPAPPTATFMDHVPVDERIKQELAQAGLCMFVPQVDYQEDDEICAEIRVLQRRLCETVCLNHYRKRRLASAVRERLAAQEFYLLLGDVDKQIEQAFAKRAKGLKKRQQSQHKRHSGTPSSGSAAAATLSPQAAAALPLVDTRDRLLSAFADLIPSQMIHLSGPLANGCDAGSIMNDAADSLFSEQAEAEVLQYARQTGHWLPIPEQPLQYVRLAKTAAHPVFPVLAAQAEPDHSQQPRERHSSIQFEQPTIIQ